MQSNLTPADLEDLQHELLQRRSQLRRAASNHPDSSAQLERDRHELAETDAALQRLAAGTYGLCLRCGRPMDHARLRLFPAARLDICCMENEEMEHEQQNAGASATRPGSPQ